jgi:hypothetical protein
MIFSFYITNKVNNITITMNEYNSPSFATMFQRALLNMCITTCFGLNPSHHQVLSYTERIVVLIHCYMPNRMHSPNITITILGIICRPETETSSFCWVHLNTFHLKTETESSLRNVVFLK